MNKPGVITIIGLSAVVGLAAACSSTANNTVTTNTKPAAANTAATATASNTSSANGSHNTAGDDTPAAVKAAFPDAQSFTTQHKDISAKTSEIEKSAGVKPTETDHHSYLAFSSAGGTRRQIGAATVVKADGKDIVIVYESKGGMPTVKRFAPKAFPRLFWRNLPVKTMTQKFNSALT